ncbi:MAG: hypothetical protein MZU79_04110 [Anaerotruncus sp.]|nr:hypothetical protein [Anaerotruncus sp.]
MLVWFYSGLPDDQPAELLQRRLLQAQRLRRLHPLLAHEGRAAEAPAVLQRGPDQLHQRLPAARGDRAPDRPGLADPHPERVRHGLDAVGLLRHPDRPEDPPVRLRLRSAGAYADKLLRYKDIIEVEYTANYLDSDALVQVTRDAGRAGLRPLPPRAEPAQPRARRRTSSGRRSRSTASSPTPEAGPSTSSTGTIPVELQGDQFLKIKDRKVSYPGRLPAHRGRLQVQPALEEHGLQGVHLRRGLD